MDDYRYKLIADLQQKIEETKVLLEDSTMADLAKKEIELPLAINPPLIGANQSKEERSLKKGAMYIYDRKEQPQPYFKFGISYNPF